MTNFKVLAKVNSEGFECEIGLYDEDGVERVEFVADADIDADGAPHAYHPDDIGLDALHNAKGSDGSFVGVLTDQDGEPLVQDEDDSAPGYYISTTSYAYQGLPSNVQRRYVNSEEVPFIVVPPVIIRETAGVVMGCRAKVTNLENGMTVDCIVADRGPSKKTGEISIAAAKALGINSNPRTGGEDRPIMKYEIWPGQPGTVDGTLVALMRSNGEYVA